MDWGYFSGRLGICRALLEARANVAMANGNGLTPLDLARRRKVDTYKGARADQELLRDFIGNIEDRQKPSFLEKRPWLLADFPVNIINQCIEAD